MGTESRERPHHTGASSRPPENPEPYGGEPTILEEEPREPVGSAR